MPPAWVDKPLRVPNAETVIKGYIDAFDPDFLVRCTKTLPPYISDSGVKVIQQGEIWDDLRRDKGRLTPKFGIGIFEILQQIFEEHFRYIEKFPLKVVVPHIPSKYSLFWAAILGEYPRDIGKDALKRFGKALDIEQVDVAPATLKALLQGNVLFPRRITQLDFEIRGRSGFRNDDFVFFMDATRVGDVVDFWNLRALGKQVLPIPKQLADDRHLRSIASDFVNQAQWPYRDNPKIWNFASFIRSRHVTMHDIQAYSQTLSIKRVADGGQMPYSLRPWYPRIWDESARDEGGADPADLISEEKSVEITETKERVQFQTLLPKFALEWDSHSEARCANEVTFRFYGGDEVVAQVIPKTNGQNVKRAISPMTSLPDVWRVGRNGLVKLVQHRDSTVRWDVPLAHELFFAWLRDHGWEAELSAPGLVAKGIFSQLQGFLRVFANEDLLKLLDHMNGGPVNEREVSVGAIKNRLSQMGPRADLHDYLISKNVFRIGAKVQCPSCQRNSWFSVESIKDQLACPKCVENFPAIGNVDKGTWCYKTAGPFSIPGYADGAYCVLLSLDFLGEHRLTRSLTSSFSFVAKSKRGMNLEADFGALWQESVFGAIAEGVVFGECKTYGKFQKRDFEKMRTIANGFPGAVLAFCTLRKRLERSEIRQITRIAKTGRKYWKSERPLNPVLILTGNELLSTSGPPGCWKDMDLSKQFDRVHSLLDLCDATQQIYLKLPSWQQTWHEDWERKRKRRLERIQQLRPTVAEAAPTPNTPPNIPQGI
jgi:hypothetical protein